LALAAVNADVALSCALFPTATREATWAPMSALVILARRIARTAWSMYTYKTNFDPARLTKCLT
jgi:hypothetical protein